MLELKYIERQNHRIFCAIHGGSLGGENVIVVPPFGDESAKSRRSITKLAEKLHSIGIGVLVPDLTGTGDSSGSLSESSWDSWIEEVTWLIEHFRAEGLGISGALAIRTGALLLSQASSRSKLGLRKTVVWQPVLDGRSFITQLLRVRIMQQKVVHGRSESREMLLNIIEKGDTVIAAGYELNNPLVAEMLTAKASPQDVEASLGDLTEFTISRTPPHQTSTRTNDEDNGRTPVWIEGEPFWNSTEIVVNQELIEQTMLQFEVLSRGP